MKYLDYLESEAISIIREACGAFKRPAVLCSFGKDSLVLHHLVKKAFYPCDVDWPLVHVDTGYNFLDVYAYLKYMQQSNKVIVAKVQDSIDSGSVTLSSDMESRNAHQSTTLKEVIRANGFDAVLGGARRDEERARAKERVFSHRGIDGAWEPENQRPEIGALYNTLHRRGEHFRVFPLSNWTELDVWRYIARYNVRLPDLYYSHRREVLERNGVLLCRNPYTTHLTGDWSFENVRFRTVGDMSCTSPILSLAKNAEEVLAETEACTMSERSTRLDDRGTTMEDRKRAGYF